MPRKTKEQKDLELKNEEKINKSTSKKPSTKSASTQKKVSTATKKVSSKKNTATTKKASATTTKKTSTSSKKATNSKSAVKKSSTKKSTKSSSKSVKDKIEVVEYYDLPYRYNQTIVKVLAQTPTNLFIYWDISDKDIKEFKEKYGEDFFEKTIPVLIVYNDTIGYNFEVEINDFANSWYLNVADSKCNYRVELGRKSIQYTSNIPDNYVSISTSNEIQAPNDKVLFDKEQQIVYFRNVKTGNQTSKPITSMSFIKNMGEFYNIYGIYKAIYENEDIDYLFDNPSSGSFSSKF